MVKIQYRHQNMNGLLLVTYPTLQKFHMNLSTSWVISNILNFSYPTMVKIPPKFECRSGSLPKFNGNFLVQRYVFDKILWSSDQWFLTHKLQIKHTLLLLGGGTYINALHAFYMGVDIHRSSYTCTPQTIMRSIQKNRRSTLYII